MNDATIKTLGLWITASLLVIFIGAIFLAALLVYFVVVQLLHLWNRVVAGGRAVFMDWISG